MASSYWIYFEEGMKALESGKSLSDNPYKIGTLKANAWANAFQEPGPDYYPYWQEGWAANGVMLKLDSCPYPLESKEGKYWVMGWKQSERMYPSS